MTLKEIYKKLRSGDALLDEELKFALAEFKKAAKILDQLGDRFLLSRVELWLRIEQMEGYKNARVCHSQKKTYGMKSRGHLLS
jgi:hypothetical protein